MTSKKAVIAYLTLGCAVVVMIVALLAHSRSISFARLDDSGLLREPARTRPLTIRERMLERRETAGRGADLAKEASARGNDDAGDAAEGGERDAFDRWFYEQRKYPVGALPVGAIEKARRHGEEKNHDDRDENEGPKWKALGPDTIPDGQTDDSVGQLSPVSGRVNAIATDPTNPDIVYAAGAQGGLWKSRNARSPKPRWEPLTDHEASLAVGSIAIDPVDHDIIYVGTGEANRSCDSYYGQGILRSGDGGEHWTLLGNTGNPFNNPGPFVGKAVSRILIDRSTAGSTTSTTLWAATTIGVFSGGTIPTCQTPSGPNVGLWRSTDSGQTWVLQNVPAGRAGVFGVQDAAIDPTNPNIVYAAVRTIGVFKSVNAKAAAATYAPTPTGFPTGSAVSPMLRINVSIGGSSAPGVLYAAIENGAAGDRLFGLYTTLNGGTSWAHVDAGFNGIATFVNVSVGTPAVTRGQVTRVTGPPFKTDNTWIGRRFLITPTGTPGAALSRTILRVLDADHLLLTTTTGFAGAATAQYSVGSYPTYCDGQCFYDMTIGSDPADATGGRIYVGGNPHNYSPNLAPNLSEAPCDVFSSPCPTHYNWRSDDGGKSWASISQGDGASSNLHTDDHAYAFGVDGSVYDGNDGGIWRSPNRGFSWTTMNTNIAITQFQGVALHPRDKGIVLGGTQDNGTNLRDESLQEPPAWFHADFGDGGMAVIDQSTPLRMFHTYFNQAFNFMGPARSDIGGAGGPGSWPFVGAYFGYGPQYYNGMDPTDPVSFYAPLTQHPAFTPNVIYFGSNRVYRAPDPQPFIFTNPPTAAQPKSWTAVSPVLTKPIVPVPPSTSTVSSAYVSWIGVLPTLVNGKEVLYSGASDGRVAESSDVTGAGVAAWKAIDKAPLPNRAVSQVLPAAKDATGNTVYATFSGFNGATPTTPGHVFKSTNGLGAATWTDISGDLPDVPANAIANDVRTGALYVGTDIGVFETFDEGAHWKQLTRGMPNIAVFGLAIDKTGRVVAATHGRGMFELSKGRDKRYRDSDEGSKGGDGDRR
jgi:photosystem II stability/assembly factor-like uncharacterized protein